VGLPVFFSGHRYSSSFRKNGRNISREYNRRVKENQQIFLFRGFRLFQFLNPPKIC
jgi:hypothetical protein